MREHVGMEEKGKGEREKGKEEVRKERRKRHLIQTCTWCGQFRTPLHDLKMKMNEYSSKDKSKIIQTIEEVFELDVEHRDVLRKHHLSIQSDLHTEYKQI